MTTLSLYNQTRRTDDLVAKFRDQRRWDLLLLHRLMRQSFLGNEGIKNSGSFRFADHIYENIPKGQGKSGRVLDRLLLSLPAARTMRRRYLRAKTEMLLAFNSNPKNQPFRLLTVPCGIPRDVADFIEAVRCLPLAVSRPIEYWGMDLDPTALACAAEHLTSRQIQNFQLVQGDALNPSVYPLVQFDFVASTGLGEFLSDQQLELFYSNVYRVLRSGGLFYTSGLDREPIAERLMKPFELQAHYRTAATLQRILATQRWTEVKVRLDRSKRQTYLVARK